MFFYSVKSSLEIWSFGYFWVWPSIMRALYPSRPACPLRRCWWKFAYIFGIWTRKNRHFLFHWEFSLFSTQQKCAGNNGKKTSRLSASFCTKNHQNPFVSLRERVDWWCDSSSKKVPKPRMRVLVMYGPMCTWMCCRYIGILGFGTFLELARHLQSTRSRRLLNGSWWFLVQNEAESLIVLFPLFPTHFCWVENNENVQGSQKCCVFLAQLPKL